MIGNVGVAVVGGGLGAGREIARGLADRGARVAVVDEVSDGAAVTAAFDAAVKMVGELDVVVWARTLPDAAVSRDFTDTDASRWVHVAERPLHEMLRCLQEAHRRLRTRGGRVIIVVPSLALTGSPGRSAWATAAEGQRSFVKVAARAWGTDGITVNCVAVDAHLLVEDVAASQVDRPGLPLPALGRRPDVRNDVTGVIASLAGADWSCVTGATVAVDGGVWMHP